MEFVEIKNTTMFNYSYSVGCYMNGNYRMGYNLTDNKYIAYYKGDGIPDEEKFTKEISKDKVLEFEKIFTELNISKWDGFRESDPNVMDGNDFSVTIRMDDKKSISASGYEIYPDNYSDFRGKVSSIFEEIFKEEISKQKTTQSE